MAAANVDIAVRAKNEASGAIREVKADLGGLEKAAGKIGAVGARAGIAAVAALGVAAVGATIYAKDAIDAASNLSETISKTNVILGKSAAGLLEWSRGTATALGMAQQQALDAASTFAVFGSAAGIAGADLNTFSTELTTLAADLASFYNTSPEQAIGAIGAALRGESEPIRAYGVLLDDATLRQQALKMGIVDTVDNALTPQQRALAATAAIFQQTTAAQGDFARTSAGLAGQQKILAASFADLQTVIGTALLPAMTDLVTQFNALMQGAMPKIKEFAENQLAPAVASISEAIDPDGIRANVNDAIGAFEHWGNASIDTYNSMLLGFDMFVSGFYNGVNGIIGAINTGIEGLNQFDAAMRQVSAGVALMRGDIATAMSMSQQPVKIPTLPPAKRPASSYATNVAADYLQLDRWEDTTRAADNFSDAIRGVGVSANTTNENLYDILQSTNTLTNATAGHGAAVKAVNKEYDDLKSKVTSIISGALDVGVGFSAEDILPREDDVNENARRLADIAKNGLTGQEWLDEFRREAPKAWFEILEAMETGGDVQGTAARIMKDFQDGLRPDLIDKGLAKERVKRMILGEQSMAALAQEVAAELAAEMGIPLEQALAAAGSALGVGTTGTPGATGAGGGSTAAAITAGAAGEMEGSDFGQQIANAAIQSLKSTQAVEAWESAGALAWRMFTDGFGKAGVGWFPGAPTTPATTPTAAAGTGATPSIQITINGVSQELNAVGSAAGSAVLDALRARGQM